MPVFCSNKVKWTLETASYVSYCVGQWKPGDSFRCASRLTPAFLLVRVTKHSNDNGKLKDFPVKFDFCLCFVTSSQGNYLFFLFVILKAGSVILYRVVRTNISMLTRCSDEWFERLQNCMWCIDNVATCIQDIRVQVNTCKFSAREEWRSFRQGEILGLT